MNKLIIILLASFLSYGCTIDAGDISEQSKNKTMSCTDFRDGEKFTFNTSSISDIRQGIFGADSHYDIVDSKGRTRIISDSMESFLKCEVLK